MCNPKSRAECGFVVEEMLLALGILCFLMPIVTGLLSVLSPALRIPSDYQDGVNIAQLRYVINCSDHLESIGSDLYLRYHEEDKVFTYSNGHLILTSPGTQIYLTDIEYCYFYMENEVIYLTYQHPESNEVTVCVGHV